MRGAMETQTSTHTAVIPALPVPGARRPAPFLPMSRAEMAALGWEACDIVLVTGDAYVDHPSFGMAIIGRLLEAQGFRVGIIAQPDWQSAERSEEHKSELQSLMRISYAVFWLKKT